MKKTLFTLLICLLPIIGFGQSQFKRGIEVGTTNTRATIDSIASYGNIFKMYEGANRLTESDVISDSIDAVKAAALTLSDLAWMKTDTAEAPKNVVTWNQLQSFSGGGGGGYGKFYYLSGNVDGSGFPNAGDSLLTHTNFIGKHLNVYREGQLQQLHTTNTTQDGYKFNNTTGTLTFRPVLSAGEQIEIWSTNTIQWENLVAEGGGGEAESPLLDSLIAGYKLDETVGTNANDVLNNNDAIVEGTVNQSTSKFGVSVLLNGSSNDITIPYNAALVPNNSTMSVSVWVYLNTLPSTLGHPSTLWATDHTGPSIWVAHSMGVTNVGNYPYISFYNTGGTEYYAQSAVALVTGQWYHIVGVCKANGSPVELWVNGVKVAFGGANFSGTLFQPLSYVTFGNDGPTGTYGTAGYMDDLYIFEQALSSTDIRVLLYNTGTGATYPFN
jgi:hypothetical protein